MKLFNSKSIVTSTRRASRSAFTVIELLVAVGVTALLVSLMLGIVINITGGWNRSAGTLESGNQSRVILDQIASDLQAAILRNDTNVWMAATVQSESTPDWTGDANNIFSIPTATGSSLPKLEDYRFGPYGVWFRFFTTVPGTNTDLSTLSAPRAVGYQIIRLPVVAGSSEVRYQLFRSEVLPNITFQTGYDLTDPNYNTTGTATDNGSLSLRLPDRANVIGNNVVDFGVRIFVSGDPNPRFPTDPPTTFLATTSTSKGSANIGMPESVEVFVRILTNEGVQQLALFENPPPGYTRPDGATWWDIVQAHSRVYTRRVDLKAKGL